MGQNYLEGFSLSSYSRLSRSIQNPKLAYIRVQYRFFPSYSRFDRVVKKAIIEAAILDYLGNITQATIEPRDYQTPYNQLSKVVGR